jgi:hypothetical protein
VDWEVGQAGAAAEAEMSNVMHGLGLAEKGLGDEDAWVPVWLGQSSYGVEEF